MGVGPEIVPFNLTAYICSCLEGVGINYQGRIQGGGKGGQCPTLDLQKGDGVAPLDLRAITLFKSSTEECD